MPRKTPPKPKGNVQLRRSKYIGEIHFYLVQARGLDSDVAMSLIADNEALIDSWMRASISDRTPPAVPAAQAARIIASRWH